MAQYIKNADPWGRIGSGLGQGIAEQLPKEIEHQRRVSGLKSLAEDSKGLSPAEFLAKAGSVYGITPQEIQSFGEIAKMQQTKNAYKNVAGGSKPQGLNTSPKASPDFRDLEFANLSQRNNPQKMQTQQQGYNQQTPPVPPQAYGQPQIVNENPLNESNLPKAPWTTERKLAVEKEYMDAGFTPEQAKDLRSDDERRDLETNRTNKERLEVLENEQKKAQDKLIEKIETKLQKKGENVFKDISGPELNNLQRGMERDLRMNPNASVEDVTNDWSERALRMAKTKNQLENFSKTVGLSSIFGGRDSNMQKLKQYSDIFKKAGNSEEFKNLLQKDLGLSPHGASSIAYPVNDKIKKYTDNLNNKEGLKLLGDAKAIATHIENMIGPEDSILSILRYITDKYHGLDQVDFLNQLSEDQDEINLNARQRDEIAKGIRENNPPGWADFYILGR